MNENKGVGKITKGLLDLLYPQCLYCICCGKITDDSRTYGMCNDCMSRIKWIGERVCTKCGKALGDNNPGDICFNCREHEHNFDKAYSCCEYGAYERSLLYELKYASRGDIGRIIAEIVYDRMETELGADRLSSSYDLVLPVPIYKKRKEKRGFNQSEIIAKAFARKAGIRYESDVIVRAKATLPMKGLSPEERRVNISGAFAVKDYYSEYVRGSRILLIDDIYTTGATADEIAGVLKSAGAVSVDLLVFAAGADILS